MRIFLKSPYKSVAFLFLIALTPYLASLQKVFYSQEVLTLDDNSLINHLLNQGFNLSEVLRPGWQGKYYRPVIDLSFFLEQHLWGGQPYGYRLTNVLIHAFNSILVYLVSKRLFKSKRNSNEISFFAALLFVLHPVTVESIAWISARTDPIATFWSLLGFLFYLKWKDEHHLYHFFFASLSIIIGILAKEVAVATPVALILLELCFLSSFGRSKNLSSIKILASSLMLILGYFFLRLFVIRGQDLGLGFILDGLTRDNFFPSIITSLASIGFYFKKFIWPIPLNFTIHRISIAYYTIIGISVIGTIGLLFLSKRVGQYCFLLIWAFVGIIPAALISFTNVAWTPWAERYLYYSVVPLSITASMATFYLYETASRKKLFSKICILILLIFGALTVNRSLVLSSNELVWKDSYRKNPDFMGAATAYASTLLVKGEEDNAEAVLNKAMSINAPKYRIYMSLGDISKRRGDDEEMEQYYLRALEEVRNDDRLVTMGKAFKREIMTKLARYSLIKAQEETNKDVRMKLFNESISYFLKAYEEHPYIFIYYEIAKAYVLMGENKKAIPYLKNFITNGETIDYIEPAKKMLANIEKELKSDETIKTE